MSVWKEIFPIWPHLPCSYLKIRKGVKSTFDPSIDNIGRKDREREGTQDDKMTNVNISMPVPQLPLNFMKVLDLKGHNM